ncbi:MAG: cytochrome c oxidase assembly factor CtaG [Paenibacillaceae bacterium]
MLGMTDFGLRALWSPSMLIVVTILAVWYILAVDQFRLRWFKESSPVRKEKKIAMLSGLAIYYLAQGGPLDLLSHLVFSMHMLSMSLSYLVVPPLIIYGTPDWMLRRVLGVPPIGKIVRNITHPILTLVLFNILFSLYHFPIVLDYVMTNYLVHTIFFIILLVSAFMMWWNVISPLPEYERLTDVQKMGYVFANGVLLTPACALIIFADSTLYATYSDPTVWAKALGYCVPLGSDVILSMFNGPGDFAFFPPLDDQQFGGVMMKLMQEIMYGIILFYIFMRWFRRDHQANGIDPLQPLKT